MLRRTFLATTTALLLTTPVLADDEHTTLAYKPGLIAKHLAAGETVFVDYATDWCSTCAAQERQIGKLRSEHPEFNKNITFIRVDYDVYGQHKVTTSRQIPRRSTLILLKGDQELGRIVASSNGPQIKEMMELALPKTTGSDT